MVKIRSRHEVTPWVETITFVGIYRGTHKKLGLFEVVRNGFRASTGVLLIRSVSLGIDGFHWFSFAWLPKGRRR